MKAVRSTSARVAASARAGQGRRESMTDVKTTAALFWSGGVRRAARIVARGVLFRARLRTRT